MAENTQSLTLQFFGAFQASRPDGPLPPLRARKVLLLLTLLTLRAGQPVERAYIIGTLWPHTEDRDGAVNLRRALADLRAWLGPDAAHLTTPTRRTVALRVDTIFADVLVFDEAARFWQKQGQLEEAEAALAVYRGPLLDGLDEMFLLGERIKRATQCVALLEALGHHALQSEDSNRAVYFARRALLIDPLSQPTQRLLYEALTQSGDLPAALRAYRDFRILLYKEMQQEPDAATVALVEQLRDFSSKPAPPVKMPPQTDPSPKESSRLPVFLTAFIGREDTIAAVATRLSEPGVRLLTLTGIGGMGKTRLAVAVAEQRGNASFVDLSRLPRDTEENTLFDAVLRVLAPTLPAGREARLEIVARLAGHPHLLVLDNCEHLLPMISHVAGAILKDSPHCQILATSRVPLGIPGEVQWPVSPVSEEEAIALFVQRARAARPNFTLTEANREVVAALCRQVEGIPLAIELAAARLRALPLEIIKERLANRLAILAVDSPTLPPRQRTMRGALEWSYTLLGPVEQQLLRSLAVFAGGWTLEAAESICGTGEDTLNLLTRLVESSLIVPPPDGQTRFRLLEVTYEFATEKGREFSEEIQAAQARHYAYFLQKAKEANDNLWGANPRIYLDALDADRENWRAAIGRANGADALDLCIPLANYWRHRGYYREGAAILTEVLKRCADENSVVKPIGAVVARMHLGKFRASLGETQDAETAMREAIAQCRESGNAHFLVSLFTTLGSLLHEQGRITEAWAVYQEGMAICDAANDVCHAAILRREMGILSHIEGDYRAARTQFETALALFQKSDAQWDEMVALWWTGFACQSLGELATATQHFEHSRQQAITLRNPAMELTNRQSLADVARDRGDFANALQLYEATLPLAEQVGDWYKKAVAWRGMSESARGLGDKEAAMDYCRRAALLAIHANAPMNMCLELLSECAAVLTFAGYITDAVPLYAFIETSRAERKMAIPAPVRARHQHDKEALRAALGDVLFTNLWQRGEKMTLKAAFALTD